MPRIFDGHRLEAAGIDGHRIRNAGRRIVAGTEAVASHVNWQAVARVGLAAALSGGNPAAIAAAVGQGVIANLGEILPNEQHQKAASDAIVAGTALANAFRSAQAVVAAAQPPADPKPAA